MTRTSRRLVHLTLASALLCLAAADPRPAETPRAIGAEAAVPVLRTLESGDAEAAARALAYPASYTPAELATDISGVASALTVLFEHYGRVVSSAPSDGSAPFYQVWISTGPRRSWWSAGGTETREYHYAVKFEKYGDGVIQIVTYRQGDVEKPVGVSFGLPLGAPEARERGDRALHALYDLMGVPKDHPIRKQQLPISQMPASQR